MEQSLQWQVDTPVHSARIRYIPGIFSIVGAPAMHPNTPESPLVVSVLEVNRTITSAFSCSRRSAESDPGITPDNVAVSSADGNNVVFRAHVDVDCVDVQM